MDEVIDIGRRVVVTGLAGSGKSTFSRELAASTGLPNIPLDLHYWKPGWVAPTPEQWRAKQLEILSADAWIADGNYHETLALRLERADTVVVMDTPWTTCLRRALLRGVRARNGQMPEGCPDSAWRRLRDEWGVAWRVSRKRRWEPALERSIISEHGRHADLHVLTSPDEANDFLDRVRVADPPSPPRHPATVGRMTRRRMFASDLDGTLLGPDHAVTARTHAAIGAAIDAGVEVVAATGRSRLTTLPILDDTAIRWAVCSNGAMVWDRHEAAIDLHRPIDAVLACDVIGHLRATIPDVMLGWELIGGYGFDDRYGPRPPSLGRHGIVGDQPEPTPDATVLKLFVDHPEVTSASEAMSVLGAHLPDGVTGVSSGGPYLELTATGVNKASTLAILADRLGVAHDDVTTFGDSHNDIEMLRWAGTGVAMGNAHPDVAAVSDTQVPTNADDGVAVWIEAALSDG